MRALLLVVAALWASASFAGVTDAWWLEPYPKKFDQSELKKQDFISVKGTDFVDEKGKTFEFKGVNIADPDKLSQQGQWNERIFKEVAKWGANTVRLPIHPAVWAKRGDKVYLQYIDDAVKWSNKYGMYLIIDWHIIGNLQTGLFQHPMYDTNWQETQRFWATVAHRYEGVPTVAVYELANEPTSDFIGAGVDSLGVMDWAQWVTMMENLIDLIYAYDENVIPLVAGFNWAYDLTPLRHHVVKREGIAYAIHPYPQKAKPAEQTRENFFLMWETQWGFAANIAPMIATEIGWSHEDDDGAHVPTINNDGSYGPNIVDYLTKEGISWTVWVFDPEWTPAMIKNWDYEPTVQGKFFKKVMQGKYKAKK